MAGVLIDVWPVWSQIRGGTYLPWAELDRACSYFAQGAPFTKPFQEGKWDGVVHLLKKDGKFPSGLLSVVRSILNAHQIPCEVRGHFAWPEKKYPWFVNEDVLSRERHIEALNAINQFKRGTLQLPTRFGKTTVIASSSIAMFGVPTLFIAHQLDLIYDAKKIFESFIRGIGEVGVIGEGVCTYRPLTVACIDSLANKLEDYTMQRYLHEKVKYVIVDETQFFGPGEYKKVLYQCDAPMRIFMSATVDRNDGAEIEIQAASGKMIYSLTEEEMIKERYISDVHVEMIPFDHGLYNKNASGIKYNEFYDEMITFNEARNKVIVDEVVNLVKEGHPTLVIVRRIEHGKELRKALLYAGIKTEFVYGKDFTAKERIKIRNDFNNGEYHVLIGSTIFDVAIDLHRASGLVLAASGNSKIRAPQRVGRVLSQAMGKVAYVKDIKDMNVKYFEDDAKDRQAVYVERYGQDRVAVRGVQDMSEIEKLFGINSMKMFDKLR